MVKLAAGDFLFFTAVILFASATRGRSNSLCFLDVSYFSKIRSYYPLKLSYVVWNTLWLMKFMKSGLSR